MSVVTRSQAGEILLKEAFELVPRGDSLAGMLGDLGMAFANRVRGLNPDAVVVRRAEQPVKPSNTEGPKQRLLAEGALVHAAASVGIRVCTVVWTRFGPEVRHDQAGDGRCRRVLGVRNVQGVGSGRQVDPKPVASCLRPGGAAS